jgi:hypothetical protein
VQHPPAACWAGESSKTHLGCLRASLTRRRRGAWHRRAHGTRVAGGGRRATTSCERGRDLRSRCRCSRRVVLRPKPNARWLRAARTGRAHRRNQLNQTASTGCSPWLPCGRIAALSRVNKFASPEGARTWGPRGSARDGRDDGQAHGHAVCDGTQAAGDAQSTDTLLLPFSRQLAAQGEPTPSQPTQPVATGALTGQRRAQADSARLEGDDENLYVFLLRWTRWVAMQRLSVSAAALLGLAPWSASLLFTPLGR